MKVKLFGRQKKEIVVDFEEINSQILKLKKLFQVNEKFDDNFQNAKKQNNQLETKDLIENMTILLNELDYFVNFREIQNIVNRRNPSTSAEQFIYNLFESLTMFWKSKKIIHQNNIFMLYRILSGGEEINFNSSMFRQKNDIFPQDLNVNLNIFDYNHIPASFNELIEYINGENEILPIINMQIIEIHSIAIFPFEKHNFLLSKILSIWYLLVYGKSDDWNIISINDYLNAHYLSSHEYKSVLQESLKKDDYTSVIIFTLNKIIQVRKDKNLVKNISSLLQKRKKIYLAEYEKKFLFMIIFHDMDEFDWKFFQNKTKWPMSKQYIIRNLTKLAFYFILISKNFKNRKFFYRSRLLKVWIKDF